MEILVDAPVTSPNTRQLSSRQITRIGIKPSNYIGNPLETGTPSPGEREQTSSGVPSTSFVRKSSESRRRVHPFVQ